VKIDINGVSITLTEEQIQEVAKHLAKKEEPKHLPKGTICWVWLNGTDKHLRVADGNGKFYYDGYCSRKKSINGTKWDNFEPLEMGLQFSEDIIKTENITPDMHKQLALCWDGVNRAIKLLKVIDAKNKCTFWDDGDEGGFTYGNYQLCITPYPNLPQWAKNMIDVCKD